MHAAHSLLWTTASVLTFDPFQTWLSVRPFLVGPYNSAPLLFGGLRMSENLLLFPLLSAFGKRVVSARFMKPPESVSNASCSSRVRAVHKRATTHTGEVDRLWMNLNTTAPFSNPTTRAECLYLLEGFIFRYTWQSTETAARPRKFFRGPPENSEERGTYMFLTCCS